MALDRLRASLADSPVVRFGDYEYFIHPITDGLPLGRPEVLDEVLSELARIGDWRRCDKIVTAESMGFPLAAGLSMRVRKPYVFIRKRRYGLPGEVSLQQTTGYSKGDMFINGIGRGDRVVFVDDVISTGGTLL
ncbi:MAG: adenine phosphoribosyltransferase, partial [Methanobacteriota archaeon]